MTTATRAATLLVWQALTPVHSGTGQSGAGVIDLPVAREVATGFPILPASSIKGVLRDGREDDAANEQYGSLEAAGKLTFTDARLLCLPVRSYAGTFAYVTCPLILGRLHRDLLALGLPEPFPAVGREVVPGQDPAAAMVLGMSKGLTAAAPAAATTPALTVQVTEDSVLTHNGEVLFEDIDLTATQTSYANQVAQALAALSELGDEFRTRLAIVPDDIFSYFSETATEVSAHIALNPQTKTVDKEKGALWYEEALPAESLLTSFVIGLSKGGGSSDQNIFALLRGTASDDKQQPLSYLQIGGKGSVGKGLLKLTCGTV